ncbi:MULTISPECIES: hypothetical protein [unclassified Diaminobutyricimonas]|uniref:hypothetical protein n=1 Tax=unclassified Diaminobutyricimonas TaxID=2643261 RepID=UPI0012F495FD|nr:MULTISPECIES: hypothetical protein [unclassified Diaminobutyricimonas]
MSAIALSSCASTSGYEVLNAEAGSEDLLPAGLPDYTLDGLDLDSARQVATHGENDLSLVRGTKPDQLCLVVYTDETEWSTTCGMEGAGFSVGASTGSYHVVSSHAPPPDDVTVISENIWLRTD